MKMLLSASAFGLISLVSCKKDSTASGTDSTFSYQLKTINRTSMIGKTETTGRTAGANIEWTSGSAFANQLKFEAENNNSEVEFKQNAAQQLDLFVASAPLGNITIPAGTYSEVEFKAFLAPNGGMPALELKGTFTSGTATVPVTFTVNSNVELKAEKNNVTVAQGEKYSALNTLDLSQLTRGITEAALNNARLTNGTILISSLTNTNLYTTLLNNLNSHHGEAEVEHD